MECHGSCNDTDLTYKLLIENLIKLFFSKNKEELYTFLDFVFTVISSPTFNRRTVN